MAHLTSVDNAAAMADDTTDRGPLLVRDDCGEFRPATAEEILSAAKRGCSRAISRFGTKAKQTLAGQNAEMNSTTRRE